MNEKEYLKQQFPTTRHLICPPKISDGTHLQAAGKCVAFPCVTQTIKPSALSYSGLNST